MDTTDDVTTRSPSILMIEGREHVLYQGSMSRVMIADARLLWLEALRGWGFTLFAILAAINALLPKYSMWLAFVGLAAVFGSLALAVLMGKRAVLTVPFAVVEQDNTGQSPMLAITSSSQRVFSAQPMVTQIATVHPQMANFLLTAFAEGHFGSYRRRPRGPSALTSPRARRQAWTENASLLVAIVAIVWIVVAMVIR